MTFLGRIISLVVLGLLLQFAAGPDARASVPQQADSVVGCSVQSAHADQLSIGHHSSIS
jgi:hypothetical protein